MIYNIVKLRRAINRVLGNNPGLYGSEIATEADDAFGNTEMRISDMEDFDMFYNEARDLYASANACARKTVNDFVQLSADPYLNAMENAVDDSSIAERVDLGILEIPVRQIVGSVSKSDEKLYTYDFMPLAEEASEYADSWRKMYQAYLSIRGLNDPIECVEYMGKFYVVDGKKRVSVLKAHGEIKVSAHVVRLVPVFADEVQAKKYGDFQKIFSKTGLYQVELSNAEDFSKLQKAMDLEEDQVWNESDRYHYMFTYIGVERAYLSVLGAYASVTAADVFVKLLEKHSFSEISAMLPWDLEKEIADVIGLNSPDKVA